VESLQRKVSNPVLRSLCVRAVLLLLLPLCVAWLCTSPPCCACAHVCACAHACACCGQMTFLVGEGEREQVRLREAERAALAECRTMEEEVWGTELAVCMVVHDVVTAGVSLRLGLGLRAHCLGWWPRQAFPPCAVGLARRLPGARCRAAGEHWCGVCVCGLFRLQSCKPPVGSCAMTTPSCRAAWRTSPQSAVDCKCTWTKRCAVRCARACVPQHSSPAPKLAWGTPWGAMWGFVSIFEGLGCPCTRGALTPKDTRPLCGVGLALFPPCCPHPLHCSGVSVGAQTRAMDDTTATLRRQIHALTDDLAASVAKASQVGWELVLPRHAFPLPPLHDSLNGALSQRTIVCRAASSRPLRCGALPHTICGGGGPRTAPHVARERVPRPCSRSCRCLRKRSVSCGLPVWAAGQQAPTTLSVCRETTRCCVTRCV
jgi:hypothetical protein